ncbi:65-kDa microtubule-associated protein 3 [Forsythia ovata]|uniref:65-kDa microtubule-associated protein 3 n=1 Tax=Forsythia ovata TaxID=205694 RepID=A0ABD1WTU7_9LAMI
MYDHQIDQSLHMETTCGSLMSELQKIWNEVGEPDKERDKMLFELEQQCLDAYRRKVDQASHCRAQLRQAIADSEVELAFISATLGEQPVRIRQSFGSLKKELQAVMSHLEEMRRKQIERKSQFAEVLKQMHCISKELHGSAEENPFTMVIEDSNLSMNRLEDLHNQLLSLQKEKSDRQKLVLSQLNSLKSLCIVVGMDYRLNIHEIHPTLDDSCGTKSISADTIERLSATINRLKDVKIQRLQRLQDLATTMVELWNLMDTPVEEQTMFQNVTKNIAASEAEIIEPNILSLDFINHAEAEVLRLQEMKSSKMKEVLLKKRIVLEDICRGAHIVVEEQNSIDFSIETIESGTIDPSYLLEQLEVQISKVKEEAFSRKDILEKVEKWLAACDEECWLEEYNRDDNRYNAGRGTHLILKRAEKARALINKIPGLVETLKSKVKAWEKERGFEFLYDGVGLLSMLEQYHVLKQQKEQERQRQRDQKKLQGQLIAEQEALFGSKPSPSNSGKKNYRPSTGVVTDKRLTLGGAVLRNAYTKKAGFSLHSLVKQQTSCSHNPSGKKNISGGNSSNSQPSPIRKPLSPITPNVDSANTQDQNMISAGLQDVENVYKTPLAHPMKNVSGFNEYKTPKTMPNTPPTTSMKMQTVMTPATPFHTEDFEYSFEERRAGFHYS